MIALRDYQQTCVDLVINAYNTNPSDKVYLVLPCGAGKTIIFSYILHILASENDGLIASMIIAHREELLDQAADKFQSVDGTAIIGKVGGGVQNYGGEITVASIQTISRENHLKKLAALYGTGKGLVIVIDECHHSESAGYKRVLAALPDAFVLGVTATPDRLDKKQIFDGKEPLFQMTIIEMIQRKYLTDMRCIAVRTQTSLDGLHTQMGDFNEKELDLLVNTPARNQRVIEAYQEHAAGRKAICFGVTVDHVTALAYAFNDAGIDAAVITGNTPMHERHRLYKLLASGEIKILTSVMVLSEGFDETSVDCVIMARPTQSRALFVQCIGRGIRLHKGKTDCVILDITDNCTTHRLTPQNLRKALQKNIQDNETVEEALAREEEEEKARIAKEAAEREVRARKLKERRPHDIVINLLEKLEWIKLEKGGFFMVVGKAKHRIAILPSKQNPELFYVAARLDPDPHSPMQVWSGDMSLEDCQQLAEKKARLLHEGELKLVDQNQPWRSAPITEAQENLLKKFKIPYGPETAIQTKGQASEALDRYFTARKKRGTSRALDREEANVG